MRKKITYNIGVGVLVPEIITHHLPEVTLVRDRQSKAVLKKHVKPTLYSRKSFKQKFKTNGEVLCA